TLTVNTATAINTQPQPQTVCVGKTATFNVTATGTGPLSYQWRKNGVNIAGATSSSYTTPATTAADNGALYTVVVTGACGTPVTSNNATLTVGSNQVVTSNADSGTGSLRAMIAAACPGSTITFANGISPISLTSGELVINKNLTIS